MSPARSEHERRGAWAVLLCLLALLPYLQTLDFGFVADDHVYLGLSNSRLLGLELTDLWRLAVAPANPWEYLPLRDLSYWLDLALHDDPQFGLHLGNFLWYVASCGAVAFATHETLRTLRPDWSDRRGELAVMAAALFAAHPAHVETVAWIAARKDLMAGTFAFLAWGASVRAARLGIPAGAVLISLLLWISAGLSKSTAVAVMPLAALVFIVLPTSVSVRTRSMAAALVLATSVCLTWVHAEIAHDTAIRLENAPGLMIAVERALRILASLLEISLMPVEASVIRNVFSQPLANPVTISVVAVLAAMLALVRIFQQRGLTLPAWGVLWMMLPLLPYLQLIPFSTWSLASERFVFQATFGVVLLLVFGLGCLHSPWRRTALAILVVAGMATAVQHLPMWHSENALWEHQATSDPEYFNSVRPHVIQLAGRGDYEMAEYHAKRIVRGDARKLLLDYLSWRRFEHGLPPGWMSNSPEHRARFCDEGGRLLEAIEAGFASMRTEPDIPFNNFLRNMQQSINPSGRLVRLCNKKS